MSIPHRERYEQIEYFIASFPYPLTGSTFVTHFSMFGKEGFRYFDDSFPYWIFYEVDEHELLIRLVSRAATSKTPM